MCQSRARSSRGFRRRPVSTVTGCRWHPSRRGGAPRGETVDMSRHALAVLAAMVATLSFTGAPAAHAAGEGCTSVSVKGPKNVPEAGGTARFTVAAAELPVAPPPPPSPPPPPPQFSRPASTTCTVTVTYATADGLAHAGEDYLAMAGSLHLAPGQKASIDVPVIDDAADEPDEDFSLQTSDGAATATIVDDDAPPTMTVTAAPAVEGAVAEVFTIQLSAPSGF